MLVIDTAENNTKITLPSWSLYSSGANKCVSDNISATEGKIKQGKGMEGAGGRQGSFLHMIVREITEKETGQS